MENKIQPLCSVNLRNEIFVFQALPGVRYFIDHKCVPFKNSYIPFPEAEEIFCSGKVHYAGD